MTLSRRLIERLQPLRAGAVPEAVREAAKLHLLDAIGVGLAAAGTGQGRPYLEAASALGGAGPASILGTSGGFAPATAALANGGLIHALEYDDTHTGSIVHGSSVIAAAALAAAEGADARGDDLLTAYVLGWEVLIRIGLAAPGTFQARGFQVTSAGGSIAAALVAAALLGLDEERTVHAVGIALSQASGVFEFLTNGSTVKSLHPGWAAHAGLAAALLARGGLTGPETAIEGRFGLFRQFAGDAEAADRFAAGIETLGEVWHLPQAAFKFYPCCHYIHPFLEALDLGLAQAPGAAVESILCEVPAGAALVICEPWPRKLAPQSGHEARYSLPVALAARLADGAVTPATFNGVPRPEVLSRAACISAREMADAQFPERFEARLNVRFADGRHVSTYLEDVFGGARRPPSREAVLAKFRANAALARGGDAAALEAAVLSIETRTLAEVTRALRGFRCEEPPREAAA
jgi:2-methylcitrate dehydratase PrpD